MVVGSDSDHTQILTHVVNVLISPLIHPEGPGSLSQKFKLLRHQYPHLLRGHLKFPRQKGRERKYQFLPEILGCFWTIMRNCVCLSILTFPQGRKTFLNLGAGPHPEGGAAPGGFPALLGGGSPGARAPARGRRGWAAGRAPGPPRVRRPPSGLLWEARKGLTHFCLFARPRYTVEKRQGGGASSLA